MNRIELPALAVFFAAADDTGEQMKAATLLVVLFAGIIVTVRAQGGNPTPRTILQQSDTSVPGHQVIAATAEFAPAAVLGWHTHPGEMVAFVVAGSVRVEQKGTATVTVAAGNTFIIPAGVPHNETNDGGTVARMLVTYVVEKGKPLNSPAVAP